MGTSKQTSPFPNAKRYSDQIFLFEYPPATSSLPAANTTATTDDGPSTVVIFGWGDGQAKHVAKYISGYRAQFPSITRIVVVLATTFKAAYQPLHERVAGMMPVIDAAFPDGPVPVTTSTATSSPDAGEKADKAAARSPLSPVLLHTMSNAGGINLASA
ncbi:hypothetical protein Micbo1qcDRAFT_166423, partial [Microdochium bolleyi]